MPTVTISQYSHAYNGRFSGRKGELLKKHQTPSGQCFGVRFADEINPFSSYGVFWFYERDIVHAEETFSPAKIDRVIIDLPKINFANEGEEVPMLKNYRTVAITFLSGANLNRAYFYALYDESISEGDTVVVQTGHHGLALAKIATLTPANPRPVEFGREIVCKVDFTAYQARREKAEKISALKKEMDAKVKDLQTLAIYEALAEKDPALKTMLDEYRFLTAGVDNGRSLTEVTEVEG